MARSKSQYICQNCGTVSGRWMGQCDSCGAWNSLVEEVVDSGIGASPGTRKKSNGRAIEVVPLSGQNEKPPRFASGFKELDRVTGGGFVEGSALLLGGDPGIGKSTLLLQTAAQMAKNGQRILYISGEEAIAQIRLRAERLGLSDAPVDLAAETHVENIIATIKKGEKPGLVIIDSIQTMWTDQVESGPGTVTQVRSSAQALIRLAKNTGVSIILVGHVTKDGQIAGPRVVEHMVDGVLYFEGDRGSTFRLLRAIKNRFGPTDEMGIFDMTGLGLTEVSNPSALFMGEQDHQAPGMAVFAGMEGTRPLLIEIQALVSPSPLGTPRRAVVGWDSNRLSMILAVLETHCGVKMSQFDVYLNIAGGYKITDPAADLAVASALVSSATNKTLAEKTVFMGEIALSGSLRPIARATARLREAEKLGFKQAYIPKDIPADYQGHLSLKPQEHLLNLVAHLAQAGPNE